MNNFYFTFGQDHLTKDGYPMKDHWVRVVAQDYGRARELFILEFSSEVMPAQDKWSFQYEEHDFKRHYFPKGEYVLIADIRKAQPDWWGYEHINGTLKAKGYYDEREITEAESSPFVAQVIYPFKARSREEALEFIKEQTKNQNYGSKQS